MEKTLRARCQSLRERTKGRTSAIGVWAWTYMSRQVFPQAPSPTITSLRRISAILLRVGRVWGYQVVFAVVLGGQELAGEMEKGWLM